MKLISNQLTIHEAHRLLKTKQLSSVELTRASLERIRQIEARALTRLRHPYRCGRLESFYTE